MQAPSILVIDDDISSRFSIEATLKSLDYELHFANNYEEGWAHYLALAPCVAILNLSHFDDPERDMLKRLDLPIERPNNIIVLVENNSEHAMEACYELGINCFLKKPYNVYEICGVVERSVALKQLQNQISIDKIDLERTRKKLVAGTTHDALTQLYNRRLMNDHIEILVSKSHCNDTRFALFYFNLDDFKKVNDTCGYEVGDQVLVLIVKRLSALLRVGDLLARMEGDEFILAIEGVSNLDALALLARELLNTFSSEFKVLDQVVYITSSIGISVYPYSGNSRAELIKNAHSALYKAKSAGRNCFRFHSNKMKLKVKCQIEIEQELVRALANDEFCIYYQPKIHRKTRTLCGTEALIRWCHPTKGLIAPNDFIPIAEKSDLIIEIGRWVRYEVCSQLACWQREKFPLFPVSVNVSGKEFMRMEVLQNLIDLFLEFDIDQRLLELEITEGTLIDSVKNDNMDYEIIRGMDVRMAIDDFGTGYCSLTYLKKFPINTLKIDKSFVDGVVNNEADASIAKTIIAMAHSLNMTVVAEGIENEKQKDFLFDNGCDQVQGYYYSRPLPVEDFERYARSFIGKDKTRSIP
ncbi:MAG: GGDEF-domain containing protein [Alteromonadaceae bacterium]|nr:MAG: GGDEF-domain containing protein [Alteromonadaceae bacterium]